MWREREIRVCGAGLAHGYDPPMSVRPDLHPIRLTDLTDCGGCAAKLGADLLGEALAGLGAAAAFPIPRSSPAWTRPTTPPPTG